MFQGEYKNTMDAKGRVNIPASFRDTLRNRYGSEEVIITRDYDGCLHATRRRSGSVMCWPLCAIFQ